MAAIVQALDRHQVAYVVVGGYAAQVHGAQRPTDDIDVAPGTDRENLERLARALQELGARARTDSVPGGLPLSVSAQSLVGLRMLNLVTRHGEVDLTFEPAGSEGYPDLVRSAVSVPIAGVVVQVAALADVIRSKTAANRPKDLVALPELHRLAGGPGAE